MSTPRNPGLIAAPEPARWVALDQFRGYTVAGMLAVNYLGSFQAIGGLWKHHNTYCSYADTIMPQFFFALGFAYRLTFLRRAARDGMGAAVRHALGRCFALLLVGLVYYGLDRGPSTWSELCEQGPWRTLLQVFQREPFQALVHLALTSLWILPVIGLCRRRITAYLVISALLHLYLSAAFYKDWAWSHSVIDGGPLGFLSWTIPTLSGALAYDALRARDTRRGVAWLLGWGVAAMALGYGLSCLGPEGLAKPPFVPPPDGSPVTIWTMSQRTGSASYLTFSTGVCLWVLAIFVLLATRPGTQLGLFRTFGTNPLVTYLLHGMVGDMVSKLVPQDAPLWYVLASCVLYLGSCFVMVRSLERQKIYLRL